MTDAATPLEEPKMEIHKPKPWHGWRDFLKEFATIVLGVSVALGAEQAVEYWHWKNRVRDAEEAMRLELRDDDGPQAYARVAMSNCYSRLLASIHDAIEAERPRDEITALAAQYRAPGSTWDSNAWNAVLASDVGSHVPASRMVRWSQPYNVLPMLDKRTAEERQDRLLLNPVHSHGEKLSAGEAETMLGAVARLQSTSYAISGWSGAFLRAMKENGITLGEDQQNFILHNLRERYRGCVVTPSFTTTLTPARFPRIYAPRNSNPREE